MKQSLDLKLGQHLTITPQLQQAIRLLQLSSIELQQEIQEALESNPLLEENEREEEPAEIKGESDFMWKQISCNIVSGNTLFVCVFECNTCTNTRRSYITSSLTTGNEHTISKNNAPSTSFPTPTTEAALLVATVTMEPELTPTTLPTAQADSVNVKLQVVSEVGQPVYLSREMVTLTRVADGETIEMIGRNDEFFNAVQPGEYILKIDSPLYEAFEERIAVSDADLELTATLKLKGVVSNPEDPDPAGGHDF